MSKNYIENARKLIAQQRTAYMDMLSRNADYQRYMTLSSELTDAVKNYDALSAEKQSARTAGDAKKMIDIEKQMHDNREYQLQLQSMLNDGGNPRTMLSVSERSEYSKAFVKALHSACGDLTDSISASLDTMKADVEGMRVIMTMVNDLWSEMFGLHDNPFTLNVPEVGDYERVGNLLNQVSNILE